MIKRRSFLLGASALPVNFYFPTSAFSQEAIEAPLESRDADFAQAWELVDGSYTQLVAADNDLPSGCAEKYGNIFFNSALEIDDFFKKTVGAGFIDFFNSQIAGKAYWAGKRISSPKAQENFGLYWRSATAEKATSLTEFLCYMSVFINEIEGNLSSRTEGYGSKDHPGISYLFDIVSFESSSGRKWRKKSYNSAGDYNRSAFDLFNDQAFLDGRQNLRFFNDLAFTKDTAWQGTAYPASVYPTSGSLADSGIILECDFFKFRGRGLIQTTWRKNYLNLVKFINANSNASKVVSDISARWSGLSPEAICSVSSGAEWDALFADPDRIVLRAAVKLHAQSGKYLPLSASSAELNGNAFGSIIAMGDGIGGKGYGSNLKARVRQICLAIGVD